MLPLQLLYPNAFCCRLYCYYHHCSKVPCCEVRALVLKTSLILDFILESAPTVLGSIISWPFPQWNRAVAQISFSATKLYTNEMNDGIIRQRNSLRPILISLSCSWVRPRQTMCHFLRLLCGDAVIHYSIKVRRPETNFAISPHYTPQNKPRSLRRSVP